MKRFYFGFLLISMILLSACSNKTDTPKILNKEGVAPYELKKSDTYLLQTLGLEKSTNLISFKAPKSAKSLKIIVYLKEKDSWNIIREGQVSIGEADKSTDRLEGTFAMMLKDNYVIDLNVNTTGVASYKTDPLYTDNNIAVSSHVFLEDYKKIEINKEIPVAIMAYDSGNTMRTYSTEDFFSPSKFDGMDLVQAVTMTFLDETE